MRRQSCAEIFGATRRRPRVAAPGDGIDAVIEDGAACL